MLGCTDSIRINISMPVEVYAKLEKVSREAGLTKSGFISHLIAHYEKPRLVLSDADRG